MPSHPRLRSCSVVPSLAVLLLIAACGSGGSTPDRDGPIPTITPPIAATPSPEAPHATPVLSPTGQPSPSAGVLDASFGDDGVVRGDARLRPSLTDVAIQPDGRIVALTRSTDADRPETRRIALVGHDTAGAIDVTFGTDGIVDYALCPGGEPSCAQLDGRRLLALDDGRLLVLAVDTSGAIASRLVLFDSAGAVDPSFGNRGGLELPALLEAIALAPDGGVIGAGRSIDGFALLRLSNDLVPNAGFGPSGVRVIEREPAADVEVFRHVAVQTDGRIVAGGSIIADDASSAVLARFDADGDLDATFGDGGWIVAERRSDLFRGVSPDAGPVAIAADARILVEVLRPDDPASRDLLRLLADGSVDTTWARQVDAATVLFAVAGGHVLSVGTHQVIDAGFVSSLYGVLRRFDADGPPDVTFGTGGETPLPLLDGAATFAVGAAVQRDGKLVVGCVRGGGGWLLARFVQ